MTNNINLLQVSAFPAFPLQSGGDHRKHGIISGFLAEGDEVKRFSQSVSNTSKYKRPGYSRTQICENYELIESKNPLHATFRLPQLFDLGHLGHGLSLKIWTPQVLRELCTWSDLIFVEEPWQVGSISRIASDTPIIYSSHNVETKRIEVNSYQPINSIIDRYVRYAERTALSCATAIVVTSDRDRDLFKTIYNNASPILVAPNGTYEENIREHNPTSSRTGAIRSQYGIPHNAFVGLFVGSNYGPNNSAARRISDIYEQFEDGFHALIVGSVGDSIESEPDNVHTTGYVEEIETYYDTADIALNPMLEGGGTNIKVLDYFARGLPVISTPFGMRGFSVTDGKHAVICEITDFQSTLRSLAEDNELDSIGRAARELVRNEYTWETISQCLRSELQTLLFED